MIKQEEKLFQKAKSHITQLCKIANEFEKLDLPFSISISNRFDKSQTTIECLKELKESFRSEGYFDEFDDYFLLIDDIDRVIDNKIKELEGRNDRFI